VKSILVFVFEQAAGAELQFICQKQGREIEPAAFQESGRDCVLLLRKSKQRSRIYFPVRTQCVFASRGAVSIYVLCKSDIALHSFRLSRACR